MATRKAPAAAWKPGQSGNPKGRPAGTGEVAKLRAAIADRVPELLSKLMARLGECIPGFQAYAGIDSRPFIERAWAEAS